MVNESKYMCGIDFRNQGSSTGLLPALLACLVCGWIMLAQLFSCGCAGSEQSTVVVYTALDRGFSDPILREFEKQTGIKVLAKYDTESTKTIGLVNAIRAEKGRPRCDVFWNNEIVNTVRLKNEGLLEQFRPAAAAAYPAVFRDIDGYWSGFAARARVLIVNTNLVPAGSEPDSIFSLVDPKWKGKAGIAKPLFGTTATHAACLLAALGPEKTRAFFQALRENAVSIQSGNKSLALSVSAGSLAFGLTDTDDAIIEVEAGRPVKIVYPDAGDGQLGTLFIPNTVALVKNCPHMEHGRVLIEYLLSPAVEAALARAESAQIPLNPEVKEKTRVKTPADTRAMAVDYGKAADVFDKAASHVGEFLLK